MRGTGSNCALRANHMSTMNRNLALVSRADEHMDAFDSGIGWGLR